MFDTALNILEGLLRSLFFWINEILYKMISNLYDVFIAHPELNASAIARRLGISQSLFAQYISGTKKPSKERMEDIFETIRSVGRELCSVSVA